MRWIAFFATLALTGCPSVQPPARCAREVPGYVAEYTAERAAVLLRCGDAATCPELAALEARWDARDAAEAAACNASDGGAP